MNPKRFFLFLLCLLQVGSALLSAQTLQDKINNKQQLTNIPTIYLTVPDAIGKSINDVLKKEGNVAEYHAATIQVVDNTGKLKEFTDDKLEIKVRGNSTAGDGKKPYRLKFGKDVKDAAGNVIESHKHDMLGLGYKKRNWTLLTNHKDKTLLHNALTYYVGQAVGMPFCPGYQFVDLVINGEYRGNYQISDHCEVGKNRIDVDEETGWFIEAARGDMVEEPLVEAAGLRMSIKNPEPSTTDEVTALKAEVSDYFTKLNHFWGIYSTACSMEEFVNAKTGWRAYIDEESLVNFYVGINLTDDYDGFMTVKMYREANGKLMFGPLWDKDLAYGNWQNHGKLCEEYQPDYTFCDHMARMMTDPYFVKKVHEKLHQVVDAGFVTTMQTKIDEMGEMITESQKLNQSKWWTCDDYPAARKEFADYIAEHTAFFVGAIDKKYEDMGCADLPEPGIGGEEGGIGGDNEDTPVGPYEATLSEWKNTPIPSSAFHKNASAAEIKVVGAAFVRLLNSDNENDIIQAAEWNTGNITGVTFNIDGETLDKGKGGGLYIRVGGSSGTINITITCTVPETPDTDPTESETPDPTPTLHQQLTNLPTIYLAATVGDDWSGATLEVFDKDNKLGQGTAWTKTTADVSVQYQGSGDKNKDSYRLKFESKTQLLSSGKFKQWVLLANDDDPSLMRNALAKEMGDALGLPFTPGYQFVDLYVNDTYMGTYQVTDRIKVEAGRALVTGGNKDLDWHVRLNDETEYKEDDPKYYIAGTETMPYIIPKNPDPKDDETTWNNSLSGAMTTYFQSLFAKDQSSHYTAFADGVDRQQLIQWYVAQEILCVYKGFSSIEAYRSVTSAIDQKLHIGILWDSEKSMGNTGEAPTLSMEDKGTNTTLGLMTSYAAYGLMKDIFADLWQQPWFANGVKNLWDEKNETMLAAMKTKADELKKILAASQAQDAAKWNNTANYNDAVTSLTSWLDTRFAYLTTKFTALANALPCTEHTYNNKAYAQMEDKTYRLACDNCGAAEEGEGATIYYKFEVYTTSKTPTAKMTDDPEWPSKQDVTDQPNTLFVTEAADLTGTNVVSDGNCSQLVITDGYPFYNPAEFKAQEASYKRMVKAETQWGTLCLPFKVVDNDDVALFTLTGVANDDDSKPGVMTFSPATKTGKATPLVFRKKKADATEICFTAGKNNGTITVAESKDYDRNNSEEMITAMPGWQFFGNVKKTQKKTYTELAPEGYTNIYVISGDKFWHATGNVTIPPFRAFFGQADTGQGPAAAQFRICINGADGIDYIEQEVRHEAPTYDIKGHKVRGAAKGLYVVDGKKIFVR